MTRKALVLLSGGQDSTTALLLAHAAGVDVHAIGFDYGQTHGVELQQAAHICAMIGVPFRRVEVPSIAQVSTSTLLGGEAHDTTHPESYTPGRNIVMMALAATHMQQIGVEDMILGVCQEDAGSYPDCRHGFVRHMREALCAGLGLRLPQLVIKTPLIYSTKALMWSSLRKFCGQDAVDLVLEHTHTCYLGGRDQRHAWGYGCGECGACVKRAAGWQEYTS